MHPRAEHSDESCFQDGSVPHTVPLCASCNVLPASTSKGTCFACLNKGAEPPHRPPPAVPLAANDPPPSSLVQQKLGEAYGTDGFNQRSGLNDTDWQRWHARLAPLRGCLWDPPDGAGKRLTRLLATEARRWRVDQQPSERILICINTVLFRSPGVTSGEDIRKTVEWRMDQWEKGEVEQLVQETERNNALLAAAPADKNDANDATLRQFNRLVQKGKIPQAVRYLTEQGGGGVLDPNELAEGDKHGRTVREVLESKHPAQGDPDPSCFLDQPLPPLTQVEITANHIERAARATQGGAGPLGGESSVWRSLLLKYGPASAELRGELAATASHIANEDVPWERMQALRSCRLIGLDKKPGVRPIGIGEVPMRVMARAMAWVTGVEVEIACGADQLCARLKGGAEGGIHVMSGVFDSGEVDCVLLVDATNAFNSVSRPAALWNARILWPRAARFLFNTYRGQAALYMRGQSAPLWSREGTTQGDPMAMLFYAAATLPLIRELKSSASEGPQTWFADDSAKAGGLQPVRKWWDLLNERGPPIGYHPDGKKSKLVVRQGKEEEAREVFAGTGVQIVGGARYMGGFVGTRSGKRAYAAEKVREWERCVYRMAGAAAKYPQAAHTALTASLQAEWDFLMRVMPEERETFEPLRRALSNYLEMLAAKPLTETETKLMMLPARHGGMGVRDPTERVETAYKTSTKGSSLLVSTIQNGDPPDGPPFNPFQHRAVMHQAVREGQKEGDETAKKRFNDSLQQLPRERQRTIKRAIEGKTAGWITCRPDAKDHTDLTPDEFRDNMAIRYGYEPPKIDSYCDGCAAEYSLEHALNCRVGGLVTRRHDETVNVLCDMTATAYGQSAVKKEVTLVRSGEEEGQEGVRTDMVVRGVWERQKDASFDLCVVNADAPSYRNRNQSTASVLAKAAKDKKRHHLRVCEDRSMHFTPLCVTVDGVWGREANAFFSRLVEQLRTKAGWRDKSYGQVMGWVRARLSVALARGASVCVRGGRRRWHVRQAGAEDAAGMFAAE